MRKAETRTVKKRVSRLIIGNTNFEERVRMLNRTRPFIARVFGFFED
jgi:hypothetical protein